jgi:pimeloyl-ACP methyl ester carboxylesterase
MTQESSMSELKHRFVETNGIRMHVVEQGEGPLVLLCHGWPESWYSWRHQIRDLAAAGYRVVAPDQRGYGQTDAPQAVEQYTILHLVGDMVGLLDALGAPTAVIAGHDWGAPVAWNCALMRPDRFPAVIGMSVPYSPRGPISPIQGLKLLAGENFFYILYFQEPGVAEAELEADVRAALRRIYYSASGRTAQNGEVLGRHDGSGVLAAVVHGAGPGLLHQRVPAHRLPRRSQLVPQSRPYLGADRPLDRCQGNGARAVHYR